MSCSMSCGARSCVSIDLRAEGRLHANHGWNRRSISSQAHRVRAGLRRLRRARGRYRAALSRRAYGELIGWLDNIKTDFFAIDDLAVESDGSTLPTPARYDDAIRATELRAWADHGISTLSYATLGRQARCVRVLQRVNRTFLNHPVWSRALLVGAVASPASARRRRRAPWWRASSAPPAAS